jgi:cyclopropane-fatty-acyl-phospholipid synthase
MGLCEEGGFSVLDVENLRLHYASTLEHWLERFEQHADEVSAMYDEHFTRAWRMYLAGSIAAFRVSALQLFQVVFTRGDNNAIPRNRKHLYETPAAPEKA